MGGNSLCHRHNIAKFSHFLEITTLVSVGDFHHVTFFAVYLSLNIKNYLVGFIYVRDNENIF